MFSMNQRVRTPAPRRTPEERLKALFRFNDSGRPAIDALCELASDRGTEAPPGLPAAGRLPSGAPSPLAPLELLLGEVSLPAVPRVMLELLQVINHPASTAADLAEVIGMDAGLSSHLLRTVNSAYYNFPFPIDTVQRAVALMGVRELSLMAFSASFLKMFNRPAAKGIDLEGFWRHSIGCGLAARAVAVKSGKTNPERHFLAGLLHDIGRLVLSSNLPHLAAELSRTAEEMDVPLHRAEREVLGFDHGRFGGALLRKWRFPATLVSAVHDHHHLWDGEAYDEPATVHLADILVKALGLGFSGEATLPPLAGGILERLKLAPEDLAGIAEELLERFEAAFQGLVGAERGR